MVVEFINTVHYIAPEKLRVQTLTLPCHKQAMIRGSLLKWPAGSRAVTCAGGVTGPATGDGAVRESVLRVGLGLIKRKVGRVTTIKVSSTIKYPKS